MSDLHRKIGEIFCVFLAVYLVGLAVVAIFGSESPVFQQYRYAGFGIAVVAGVWIVFRSPKD